jgi:hypothetical protein
MQQSNFDQLQEAGLIVPDYKFTDQDLRAIESLSQEEVNTIVRVVRKLAPQGAKVSGSAVRGIIL